MQRGLLLQKTLFPQILLLTICISGTTGAETRQQQTPGSNPSSSPEMRLIRVGVPIMENTSTRSVNRKLQRDWLVKALQPAKRKKDKSQSGPMIEPVPLDGEGREAVASEARDKNCDYILYTNVVELREPGDPTPANQPGTITIGRDPLAGYPDPTRMHEPVHYAVVDYQLLRMGSLTPLLDLSVSGEKHSDENGTVQSLLFVIANRVLSELSHPVTSAPE